MKKIITFLFPLCLLLLPFNGGAQADKIRDNAAKTEIVALQEKTAEIDLLTERLANLEKAIPSIPDSFMYVIGGDTLYFPIKDGVVIFTEVKDFVKENEGNWPTSFAGWMALLFALFTGGKLTQVTVSAKRIWESAKPFLGNKLSLVAIVALLLSAVIALLFGKITNGAWALNYDMFTSISGWIGMVAVFIYERFVKEKQPETVTA